MSLAIKYETVEDATMRLRNTVVLYKGNPVFILEVRRGEGKDDIFRVLIQELPTARLGNIVFQGPGEVRPVLPGDPFGAAINRPERKPDAPPEKKERKYISSKHFDIAPFPLGYVNQEKGNGVFYCSRMPNRMQKQGLCQENFKGVDNFGAPVQFGRFLQCKGVIDMVHGVYPSITEARKMLDEYGSVAFDRHFCLMKDEVIPELAFLYYKGSKVGMFRDDQVMLGNKYMCLRERLDEMELRAGAF